MSVAAANRALCAALLIIGSPLSCAKPRPGTITTPPDPTAIRASASHAKSGAFAGEEEFAEVAVTAPSFAGFYYSAPHSDTLVVAVANMDDADRARDAVAKIFARKRNLPPFQVLVVRKVRHSFLQLHRWRTLVEDRLFALQQVTALDLDEAHNTVTVGVLRKADRAGVRSVLRSAGVPSDAYRIIDFGPVIADPERITDRLQPPE